MSNSKCTVDSKLSDDKCLVVEFINERQKPVQVGFQAWLKEEDKSDLHHLLNSEVIIRWPIKEDIKCARMMEKILKKKDIIWEDLIVRVRSVGTFTDMCQHVKNIEFFGVPNPSREERRTLCKRSLSSDEENVSELNSSAEKDNIKSAKIDKSSKKQKKIKTSTEAKHQKSNYLLQSQIENLSTDFIKKTSRIDLINDSEEEEDDEDNPNIFKWSKAKLVDLINTLKLENKKLREDNARLRTLRAINEDLNKMTAMSSTLRKDIDGVHRDIDSLLNKVGRSNNKNDNSDKHNNDKSSHSNQNFQDNNFRNNTSSTLNTIERYSENPKQQVLLTVPTISHTEQQLLPTIVHTEQQLLPSNAHTEQQLLPTIVHTEQQLLPTNAHTEQQLLPTIVHIEQPVQFENESSVKENVTDFAGRKVKTEKLRRLSRSKLSLFTTSVMDLVFTDEEMATSSMTGIISNFSRGKNKFHIDEVKAKPELNPPVKKAMMEYITKEFNYPADGPLYNAAMTEIFKAMKIKLNNKSKTWRIKTNQKENQKEEPL